MYDDESPMKCEPVEADSPYVDKMRKYVDLERAIERHRSEARQIDKRVKEMAADQNKLRASLDSYLNGDRAEAAEGDR